MFAKLKAADDAKFTMSFATPDPNSNLGDKAICNLNLPCSHAYTLISTKIITKKDGTKINLY